MSSTRTGGSRVPLARLKAAKKAAAGTKALADATREHLKKMSKPAGTAEEKASSAMSKCLLRPSKMSNHIFSNVLKT